MIVWATSTNINSPASIEESKAILFSLSCACVSAYVSIVVPFSACQSIFGFNFQTVL